MVNISIMKNLFEINVFTYLFLILSMLSGYLREIFIIFLILLIHELGHFLLMKLNSIKVESITIYPYGGMIKSDMMINTNSFKVLLISLGGVFIQLVLWLIIFSLFKIDVINVYYYDIFCKYNLYIIIFNLIPIYPLDGFKIFNSFFEMFLSFKISLFISFIINIVCLILFMVYLYIYKINNYVIVIFLLVNLINYIKNIRFLINKFYLERTIYDLKYSGLVSVKDINCFFKNKYNYINGVGEKEYLNNRYYGL